MLMSIDRDNYVSLQGWMITDLKLSGNELIVYAIIYGFSQTTGNRFTGSLNYLASWLNATKQTALNALQKLVAKGLIEKFEVIKNNVKFCEYACVEPSQVLKNFEYRQENSLTVLKNFDQVLKNFDRGIKNFLPNNIIDNIEDNIDKNIINNNIIYDRENSDEFSTQDKIPDQNHTKVSTNNMPDINTNAQSATCLVDEYITPQTPDPLPPAGATNVVTKSKRGRKNVIEGDVEIKGQRMADNDNEQSRANKEKQIEKAEKKKVSTEEKKKLNARKMAEEQIKEYTENEELRQTFLDFVDSIHDGKIGQIVSKTRVSQWLKILDDCSSDSERIKMLEVSIGSGYGTLYIQDNIRSVKRNRGRKTAKSVAETTFQEVQKDEDTDDSEDWRHMII